MSQMSSPVTIASAAGLANTWSSDPARPPKLYVVSPLLGLRFSYPAASITWTGSSAEYELKSPVKKTGSMFLSAETWLANATRAAACRLRSPL